MTEDVLSGALPAVRLTGAGCCCLHTGTRTCCRAPGLRAAPDLSLFQRSVEPLPVVLQGAGGPEGVRVIGGVLGVDERPAPAKWRRTRGVRRSVKSARAALFLFAAVVLAAAVATVVLVFVGPIETGEPHWWMYLLALCAGVGSQVGLARLSWRLRRRDAGGGGVRVSGGSHACQRGLRPVGGLCFSTW